MTITYARVGGPPDNWTNLRIIDLDTGEEYRGGLVREIDTEAGWLVRYVKNKDGTIMVASGQMVYERVDGNFRIEDRAIYPSGC